MSSSDDTDGPQEPRDGRIDRPGAADPGAQGPGAQDSGLPGGADPAAGTDQAGEQAAGSPKGKRRGLAVGGGIAGIVVILAVVFGSLYATDTAPFGGSEGDSDAAIASVTRDYVNAAMNTQKVQDVLPTLCSADAERLADLKDGPGNPNTISVDDVSDIRIQGDVAAAKVTISGDVDGERQQDTATVPFKKEDGHWKVCPSAAAAGGSPAPGGAPQGGGVPQGGAPQGGVPQGGAPQGGAPQGGAQSGD